MYENGPISMLLGTSSECIFIYVYSCFSRKYQLARGFGAGASEISALQYNIP